MSFLRHLGTGGTGVAQEWHRSGQVLSDLRKSLKNKDLRDSLHGREQEEQESIQFRDDVRK